MSAEERSFRARISDPIGPRWTRMLLPTLALGTLVLDYLWAAMDDAGPGPAFYVAMVLLFVARPLLGRHRSRNCELVLSPGKVRVRDAGLLNQTIETADVSGASTSVGEDGRTTLAIARTARMGRPLHFEVATSTQANEMRQALGIGFGGYGTLAWKVAGGSFEIRAKAARFVGVFAAAWLTLLAVREQPTSVGLWIMMLFALAWVYLGPFFRQDPGARNGTLWFNEAGVFHAAKNQVQHVSYTNIKQASADGRFIRIENDDLRSESIPITKVSHSLEGVSELELAHITGQLRDAGRRAHGEVQPSEAATGVELLMRSSGDAPRTWLERLDSTATNLGGGYRSANLTKDSLLRALEDPDASPDVRVGAARVLYRIAAEETTTRVKEICETVRDPGLKKQLRVVLTDDLDEAAAEIEIDDAKARV